MFTRCAPCWTAQHSRFCYLASTAEQFKAPEAAKTTAKDEADLKNDPEQGFWTVDANVRVDGELKTKLDAVSAKEFKATIDGAGANTAVSGKAILEDGNDFYRVTLSGTKEAPAPYTYEKVTIDEVKYKDAVDGKRQEKLKELFSDDFAFDHEVKKGDTLSGICQKETYPDKKALVYQYTNLNDDVIQPDKDAAVKKARDEKTDLPAVLDIGGKLVWVYQDINGPEAGDKYQEKKFDQKSYDAALKDVKDQYAALMNAMAEAGLNPNMIHPGDRVEVFGGVLYIDTMDPKSDGTKHLAIKLYKDANVPLEGRPRLPDEADLKNDPKKDFWTVDASVKVEGDLKTKLDAASATEFKATIDAAAPNAAVSGKAILEDGNDFYRVTLSGTKEAPAPYVYEKVTINADKYKTASETKVNVPYSDLTNAAQNAKIVEQHKAITEAKDALVRGTLYDVFRAYNIPFTDASRAKIWKKMVKAKVENVEGQYKKSAEQNRLMVTYMRKLGDEGLKALAVEMGKK